MQGEEEGNRICRLYIIQTGGERATPAASKPKEQSRLADSLLELTRLDNSL
jgi:hypothetical protein